jgi:hypothetical protein
LDGKSRTEMNLQSILALIFAEENEKRDITGMKFKES